MGYCRIHGEYSSWQQGCPDCREAEEKAAADRSEMLEQLSDLAEAQQEASESNSAALAAAVHAINNPGQYPCPYCRLCSLIRAASRCPQCQKDIPSTHWDEVFRDEKRRAEAKAELARESAIRATQQARLDLQRRVDAGPQRCSYWGYFWGVAKRSTPVLLFFTLIPLAFIGICKFDNNAPEALLFWRGVLRFILWSLIALPLALTCFAVPRKNAEAKRKWSADVKLLGGAAPITGGSLIPKLVSVIVASLIVAALIVISMGEWEEIVDRFSPVKPKNYTQASESSKFFRLAYAVWSESIQIPENKTVNWKVINSRSARIFIRVNGTDTYCEDSAETGEPDLYRVVTLADGKEALQPCKEIGNQCRTVEFMSGERDKKKVVKVEVWSSTGRMKEIVDQFFPVAPRNYTSTERPGEIVDRSSSLTPTNLTMAPGAVKLLRLANAVWSVSIQISQGTTINWEVIGPRPVIIFIRVNGTDIYRANSKDVGETDMYRVITLADGKEALQPCKYFECQTVEFMSGERDTNRLVKLKIWTE